MSLMEAPVQQPVLHVFGDSDPMMLAATMEGTNEYVRGPYVSAELSAGHFVHEETPSEFRSILMPWLHQVHERG